MQRALGVALSPNNPAGAVHSIGPEDACSLVGPRPVGHGITAALSGPLRRSMRALSADTLRCMSTTAPAPAEAIVRRTTSAGATPFHPRVSTVHINS